VASYVLFGLLTAVCLLQLFNLATLAAFWPFFGAIVALLFGAMYQFVRLVLTRDSEVGSGGVAPEQFH
jgi:hypothetical protein